VSEAGTVNAVSSRAWSELLHAEVGARLGAAGIPCLHIKGPTVATWLYEPGERSWGDVDILVPPSRMNAAIEILLAAEFSYRDPGMRWWTSEDHALTLKFDPHGDAARKVAAEVDIHHRFLGIEGDPERVFAELWRRREPYRLAELEVWFPDLATRRLIAVLNAARDPQGDKAPRDLRRLLAAATDADWARTIALAGRVEALEAMRAGLELEEIGREVVARTSLSDVRVSSAVRLRAEGSSRTAVRIQELRTFGTWKKVKMLAGWVVPSPAVIRMREPSAAGSPWRMARAYLHRYRQGARELLAMRHGRPTATSTPMPTDPRPAPHEPPPPLPSSLPAQEMGQPTGTSNLVLSLASLARPDGSVALVSGELDAALVQRGWAPVTDVATEIDPENLEVLADRPGQAPREVRLLVVAEYDEQRAGPDVSLDATRLSAAEVADFVTVHSTDLGDVEGGPEAVLARLVRRVPAYRLAYSDDGRAADEVTRLWRAAMDDATATVPAATSPPVTTGYRRADHVAACHDRDQVVLLDLHNGIRQVLSPTAAAIWDALLATGSLPAAIAELEEEFPDAPGLAEDTVRFVAELEEQGFVERART
jgi:hypothetical protein